MTASEFQQRFLTSLDENLGPLGFHLVRDAFYGLSFIRDIGDTKHFFDLSLTKQELGVDVTNLFVGTRFNGVEQLVATYEEHPPIVTERDLARRRTLGTRLGCDKNGFSPKKWTINDEPGLLRAVNEVRELLETTGFTFLGKYSRADEAMRVLEADDEEARRLVGPDDKRAKEAIAMALLTGGLAAAIEMRDKKLAFLASSPRKDAYHEVSKWAHGLFAQEKPNV